MSLDWYWQSKSLEVETCPIELNLKKDINSASAFREESLCQTVDAPAAHDDDLSLLLVAAHCSHERVLRKWAPGCWHFKCPPPTDSERCLFGCSPSLVTFMSLWLFFVSFCKHFFVSDPVHNWHEHAFWVTALSTSGHDWHYNEFPRVPQCASKHGHCCSLQRPPVRKWVMV